MALDLNRFPYFDDFDANKQFMKVLFNPGRAVQARELTQMQSILQHQVSKFGEHIFKEGSLVIPGSLFYDDLSKYVKFDANTTNEFLSASPQVLGKKILGENGLTAVINHVFKANGFIYCYIKYLNSANDGVTNRFSRAESVTIEGTATGILTSDVESVVGTGTIFSVTQGVIFTQQHFVQFPAQTIVVSPEFSLSDVSIGFNVNEQIVTSDQDETLLDNAQGSYNFTAPGADRFKIGLELTTRPLNTSINDDKYVELYRIENSIRIYKKENPEYAFLENILARRTFDESGDYTVRPYTAVVREHLRVQTNAGSNDGVYANGNENQLAVLVRPGKAYVKGFEVENLKTAILSIDKSREFTSENAAVIRPETQSHILIDTVSGVIDFNAFPVVNLYSVMRQPSDVGAPDIMTKVGTARVRGMEYFDGNSASSDTQYRLFLFDVKMDSGKLFNQDVKQLYLDNTDGSWDFSANIVPTFKPLTGTVSYTVGSSTVDVNAGRLADELRVGDYIQSGNARYLVNTINLSASTITVTPTPTVTQVMEYARIETQVRGQVTPLIHRMPNKGIRSFLNASSQTDATYEVKRVLRKQYDSLSGVTFNRTVTDEVFQSASVANYFAYNATNGFPVRLTSITVSPTGASVTLVGNTADISVGQNIVLVATIRKTNASANHKTKLDTTSVVTTVTSEETLADLISLGKADAYEIVSITQSASGFGSAYNATGETNITKNYVLENGQTPYYYGISAIRRVGAKPTAPIKITFKYFRHTTGDYFSVDSYADIDYVKIPTAKISGVDYALRDCLDFRPRIDTDGDFLGGESSQTEFITSDSDFIVDYSYYLPRVDKIWIDTTGKLGVSQGKPSLFPQEPTVPDNVMTLFVLRQEPYVFDARVDASLVKIEHKRYTMRDIGKLETRIKNLEYYTTLSLLEREAASYQIKDENGFDRFKNGFVVDAFKGHGVGDVTAPGYRIGIDYNKYEARAVSETLHRNLKLRNFSNMVVNNGIATLPFTERKLISVNVASRAENINPFSVVTFVGKVELDPPADIWKDTTRVPDIYLNVEGNYNNLLQDAQVNGKFETIWGEWRDMWFGNATSTTTRSGDYLNTETTQEVQQDRTGTLYEIVERIDVETRNDVVLSSQVIPKMRNTNITFKARGMKPNTRVHVFFDGVRVTDHCHQKIAESIDVPVTAIRPTLSSEFAEAVGIVRPLVLTPEFLSKNFTGDRSKIFETETYGLRDVVESNVAAIPPLAQRGELAQSATDFLTSNALNIFDVLGTASGNLITDSRGNLTGTFYYKSENFDMDTGDKVFRITDSATDGSDKETVAQTVFKTSGELLSIRNEITSTRNADLTPKSVSENRTITKNTGNTSTYDPVYVPPTPVPVVPIGTIDGGSPSYQSPVEPVSPPVVNDQSQGLIAATYNLALGRQPDSTGLSFYEEEARKAGITPELIQEAQVQYSFFTQNYPGKTIDLYDANNDFRPIVQPPWNSRAEEEAALGAAQRVYEFVQRIADGAISQGEPGGYFGLTDVINNIGEQKTANLAATQTAAAILNLTNNPLLQIVGNVGVVDVGYSGLPLHGGNNEQCPPTTGVGQVYDPLAQSFFVERDLFLSSADIFMQSKDSSIPLRVQLVRMVNGYPGSDVIPGSEVIIDPELVNISDDATVPTKVVFDYPIYVEAGQYAIVLLADSQNYKAWVSRMDENDITTGSLIAAQPSLGSLFKSQNAITWTADQYEDLKFALYNAVFNTGSFTSEFEVDVKEIYGGDNTPKRFDNDPIQLFNGSALMRVYCKNHDLNVGSFFKIDSLLGLGVDSATQFKNGDGLPFPIYGLNFEDLVGLDFEVSKVTNDYFEVNMLKTAAVPEGKVRFGSDSLRAALGQNFDYLFPTVASITPAGTELFASATTCSRTGTLDAAPINVSFNRDNEFIGRTILNENNNTLLLGNTKSFVFRITGASTDRFLTPVIDLKKNGVVFIKNIINNPSVEDNNVLDYTQFVLAGTNTVTVSNNRISFGVGESAVRTYVKTIQVGSTLDITAPVAVPGLLTGKFTIKSVGLDGAFIELVESIFDGSFTGTQVTLKVADLFIDETAPAAGSVINKYVSKKFDFTNPSTSINFRLAVNRPADTNVELYYRVSFVNEAVELKDKEWVRYGLNAPVSQDSRFVDVEREINLNTAFNSIQVKVVITSSSTVTPKFTDMRLISLA